MIPNSLARRRCLWLAPLLLCLVQQAGASNIGPLYEVSVPLQGGGDAAQTRAFSQAMEAVLVRVTGRRDAAAAPGLAGLVADAQRYVRSYRRLPGGLLSVTFDGNAVERAVAGSGLPFWGAERPTLMVWLALGGGEASPRLVTSASTGAERRTVELIAAQRGLPLAWPAVDGGDDPRLRGTQVGRGDIAALRAASERYGAEAILIGQPDAGAIRWTLVIADDTRVTRGGLEDGVHLAADRLASRLAVAGGARRNEVVVEITGITTAEDFAAASRHIESLELVRGIALSEVRPDTAVFALTVRGDAAELRRALVSSRQFIPAGTSPAGPIFRWQP